MKTKAAVLYETNTPLRVEEIDLADPKPGEVRVKLAVSGICGADSHLMSGHMLWPLPIVPGHEGAGIVDAVGAGVTRLKEGDHVIVGVTASCGKCARCAAGQPFWCEGMPSPKPSMRGVLPEGTSRLSKDGKTIHHMFCQSSFAEYVVASETQIGKIRDDAPFDKVCALGCGVGTGLGAVINNPKLKVEPGASVVIFGCGTVGLSALMGAKLVGAGKIVSVDVFENKLALAKELGATHTINSKKENVVDRVLQEIGPVDFAFECVGSVELASQAFNITKGAGNVVLIGAVGPGEKLSFDGFTFLLSKSVMGVTSGFLRPAVDLARYVELYMVGQLPLDKLVTGTYRLEGANKAIEALRKGDAVKGVLVF